ncbi:MAG: hypothetical protein ACSLE1_12930, partial [Sphingobium sp.]
MHKFIISLLSASTVAGVPLCPVAHAASPDPGRDAAPSDTPSEKSDIIVTGLKHDDGQARITEG